MNVRALLAVLLLTLALPAAAQDETPSPNTGASADISGYWRFSTGPYHVVCSMTGEITLHPTADPNVFEGDLVAWENCAGRPRFEAKQTAVVIRDGDGLTITSTLNSVEPPSDLYCPDDFVLRIMHSSLMIGELHSADILATAQFRRGEGPIA